MIEAIEIKRSYLRETPDADRIRALLRRHGEATTRIAERADKSKEKLTALGTALTEAGEESHDEEEDTEAAANPVRKRKAA